MLATAAAVAALAVVVLYGAVLVEAGLSSRPRELAPGGTKCFDDWCARLLDAHATSTVGGRAGRP